MSNKIVKTLKIKNLGERTNNLKKQLSDKAFDSVKSSFSNIKQGVVNKHINESKKAISEASVFDSLRDFSTNSNKLSKSLPNGGTIRIQFQDKSGAEVSFEDAKMATDAFNKITEPVLKQQLINQMDLSLNMFNNALKFLKEF